MTSIFITTSFQLITKNELHTVPSDLTCLGSLSSPSVTVLGGLKRGASHYYLPQLDHSRVARGVICIGTKLCELFKSRQ